MFSWSGGGLFGREIETLPDFVVMESASAEGADDEEGLRVSLSASFDEALGRYYIESITVSAESSAHELTGAVMRDLPLHTYLREALLDLVEIRLQGSGEVFSLEDVRRDREAIVAGGPSSWETLRAVARVYRAAEILGLRPAKAVQDHLGLTAPTATLWIRRARDIGLIRGDDG